MAEALVPEIITPCEVGGRAPRLSRLGDTPQDHSPGMGDAQTLGGGADHQPAMDLHSDTASTSAPSTSSADSCTMDPSMDIDSESGGRVPIMNLTVSEPSLVEAELDKMVNADLSPSKAITVVKWLAMIFMFLAFLACLTISKISLLHISSDLMVTRSHRVNKSSRDVPESGGVQTTGSTRAETDFLMLVLIMLIPYGLTLVRSVWCAGFRSDKPWPCWKAVGWTVLASLLESFGLSLFTLDVLSETPSYISVLLMNGVFLAPIVTNLAKKCSSSANHAPNKAFTIVFIFALLFEIAGVVLTFVFEARPKNAGLDKSKMWEVPVSLICLSIAWSPVLLRAQMIPRQRKLEKLLERRRLKQNPRTTTQESDDVANVPDSGHVSGTSSIETDTDTISSLGSQEPLSMGDASTIIANAELREDTQLDAWELVASYPEVSARWKSSIIRSILKILLVPAFSIMLGHYMHIVDVHKLHDGLLAINSTNAMFPAFMVNIFVSFAGYLVGWGACVMCMRISAFALPLILATPVALLLVIFNDSCQVFIGQADMECKFGHGNSLLWTLPPALCLYVAQLLSTSYFIYRTRTLIMQRETQIFWMPGYSGVFLEQWMLLDRKNVQTDDASRSPDEVAADTHVLMCTTMYREAPREMEQLLQSIKGINLAQQESQRKIESHIFFDNGVRDTRLTEFPLQLISIAKKVLGATAEGCTKVLTPYGMKLTWVLSSVVKGRKGMAFSIHLKDNRKVKNKKRWSQVMYMSYVLDFYMKELRGATEENTYILATDADVKFSPHSVEALLDLMTRDSSVGAVCARTHPMGTGPVVWYQIFDYAIGHWLQKAANHVLGSVLCSPGCFSVYRAVAIKDVLTTYASQVNEASEFLTKDMGEDRWLCTLMVQSGWKLEYCAAASDSTYCPEDFDEFFKQRRRWIPSTLANQFLLLAEWNTVSFFNKKISFMFMMYQAMLLFSTLINPAVCILIIVGGLYYAWGINQVFTTIMLILVAIGYTFTCLYASPKTQLWAAKVLTIGFALIMAAVTIGTAEEIVGEYQSPPGDDLTSTTAAMTTTTSKPNGTKFLLHDAVLGIATTTTAIPNLFSQNGTTPRPDHLDPFELPASVSTLYLAGLTLIFLVTAILHLPEAYCLVHGVWYLLCLPGGNLILMIYSICNMTDRSWGTREEKQISDFDRPTTFAEDLKAVMKKILFCWDWKSEEKVQKVNKSVQASGNVSTADGDDGSDRLDGRVPRKDSFRNKPVDRSHSFRFHSEGADEEALEVKGWLPKNFKTQYACKFEVNGYEDTSFIGGMTDKELLNIGVKSKAHRNALLEAIKRLPEPEIDPAVPEHVDVWLEVIGLEMYQDNFRRSHIITRNNMEILKTMSREDLTTELGITKQGHLKRLMLAISKLRYPSETEKNINQVKYELEALTLFKLETINPAENDFWVELREQRLLPDSVAFAHDHDLREKLTDLRNSTLMVFAISNAIWIILITTLVTKGSLNVLHTNILGLCFLVIFGFILAIQFLCMIIHRLTTFMHLIARAPYKCGQPFRDAWSFHDSFRDDPWDKIEDSTDAQAAQMKKQYNSKMHREYRQRVKAKKRRQGQRKTRLDTLSESEEDTQHLLKRHNPAVNYSSARGHTNHAASYQQMA